MKSSTHVAIGLASYANFIMLTQRSFDIVDIPVCLAFSVLPDIDIESSKISSALRRTPMRIIQTSIFTSVSMFLIYITFIDPLLPKYMLFLIPAMILFLRFSSRNKTFKKISLSLFFIFLYYLTSTYTNISTSKYVFIFLAILPYFSHRSFSHSILAIVTVAIFLYPLKNDSNLIQVYYTAIISFASHILLGDILTKEGTMLFYPFSKRKFSLNVIKSKYLYKKIDIIYLTIYICITLYLAYSIYLH